MQGVLGNKNNVLYLLHSAMRVQHTVRLRQLLAFTHGIIPC